MKFSASKTVFIMLTLTACTAFLIGVLPVEQFMYLATGASAFYFSNKGTNENNYLNK